MQIRVRAPVKLIAGIIFKDDSKFFLAKKILVKKFGGIDFESREMPFAHTDYYEDEFGPGLKRIFISFKKTIKAQDLASIKVFTNKGENKLSKAGKRTVNIDPGYIDLSKLVLASTKDYKHRIYLNKGIYAEITLYYQDNSFKPWEWTYPDYKSEEHIVIFNQIRQAYAEQIKKI
ncbi:MAG: DUF4416 family protein [Candidatus Omnitrophota bacterium]